MKVQQFPSNSHSQITLTRSISAKPNIIFSYATLKQNLQCSPAMVKIKWDQSHNLSPISKFTYQNSSEYNNKTKKSQYNYVQSSRTRPRKKIFQEKLAMNRKISNSWVNSNEKKSLTSEKSQYFNRKDSTSHKRKNIFSPYKPITKKNDKINQNSDQNDNDMFPLKFEGPKHPKNLISYVQLAPHRKSRKIASIVPQRITYILQKDTSIKSQKHKTQSEILVQQNFQIPNRIQQTPSLTNIQFQQSIDSCSHKQTNHSIDNIRQLLLETKEQRYFDNDNDNEALSPRWRPKSYVDIKLTQSIRNSQKQSCQEPAINYVHQFKSKVDQIFIKFAGNKQILPATLILLGITLLLIQSFK